MRRSKPAGLVRPVGSWGEQTDKEAHSRGCFPFCSYSYGSLLLSAIMQAFRSQSRVQRSAAPSRTSLVVRAVQDLQVQRRLGIEGRLAVAPRPPAHFVAAPRLQPAGSPAMPPPHCRCSNQACMAANVPAGRRGRALAPAIAGAAPHGRPSHPSPQPPPPSSPHPTGTAPPAAAPAPNTAAPPLRSAPPCAGQGGVHLHQQDRRGGSRAPVCAHRVRQARAHYQEVHRARRDQRVQGARAAQQAARQRAAWPAAAWRSGGAGGGGGRARTQTCEAADAHRARCRLRRRHGQRHPPQVGDYVRLEGTRPMSKQKRFKVAEVLRANQ